MLLETKIKLRNSIPMSLFLWGGHDWSGSKDDAMRIEVLQSKVVRRSLGATIAQAKEEEATNDRIRRRLGNVAKVVGV